MSKESALNLAAQTAPIQAEAKINPVTGTIPEDAKASANPAVENGGVVPESLASTQLSHLAKKEAKLLAEREALKKEQEEFKSLKAKVQEVYDRAQAFEETRKKDPIKALRDLGFTEQEIVDYLSVEDEQAKLSPAEQAQKAAEEAIKKFREEEAQKLEDEKKRRQEAELQQVKSGLSAQLTQNPDKYKLSKLAGAAAEEIMLGIYLEEVKEGLKPNLESLADEVEQFYLSQYEEMKKLMEPEAPAVQETPKAAPERSRVVHAPEAAPRPRPTTLTNKLAATTAALAKPAVSRPETREEKRARLEAMIRRGFSK